MTIARRILSPLILLAGLALVAGGLYPVFVTLSARSVAWPIVALGVAGLVLGLLVQVAPLSRRLIGVGLMLAAVLLFVLGYPLFGAFDAPNLSWLWIPSIVLAATAMIVARGRSWWAALAALGLGIVYIGVGLFMGQGPVGWWPVNLRLPSDVALWLASVFRALWPVQVIVMVLLLGFTMLAAGAIDPGRRETKSRGDGRILG